MRAVPRDLLHGPFTRQQALALGVTSRQLQGEQFVRVHPRVWRHRDHEMTWGDRVVAARLALPPRAHLTGISRLQLLGLDLGPRLPLRFVVEGDLHLALDGIFLHRTKLLPPYDGVGVSVPAAFVAYCARARVIDAIEAGDWLLHRRHMTRQDVAALALAQPWRDGAHEAVWVLEHLEPRARSLKESEARAVLTFAGLPAPAVNAAVDVGEEVEVIGDLVYRAWRVVVEYEGAHHQEDRGQYLGDLDRYAMMRAAGISYVQVTRERLVHARTFVGDVFRALLSRGYDGPPPVFEDRWRLLFLPLSVAVGPRRGRVTGRSVS